MGCGAGTLWTPGHQCHKAPLQTAALVSRDGQDGGKKSGLLPALPSGYWLPPPRSTETQPCTSWTMGPCLLWPLGTYTHRWQTHPSHHSWPDAIPRGLDSQWNWGRGQHTRLLWGVRPTWTSPISTQWQWAAFQWQGFTPASEVFPVTRCATSSQSQRAGSGEHWPCGSLYEALAEDLPHISSWTSGPLSSITWPSSPFPCHPAPQHWQNSCWTSVWSQISHQAPRPTTQPGQKPARYFGSTGSWHRGQSTDETVQSQQGHCSAHCH